MKSREPLIGENEWLNIRDKTKTAMDTSMSPLNTIVNRGNSTKFFIVCFCTFFWSRPQLIVHGRGPSNINLEIFVCSFDVCWPSSIPLH